MPKTKSTDVTFEVEGVEYVAIYNPYMDQYVIQVGGELVCGVNMHGPELAMRTLYVPSDPAGDHRVERIVDALLQALDGQMDPQGRWTMHL